MVSASAKQTQNLARKIAKKVALGKSPRILGLAGNLGSGKTTFIQGFAKALNVKTKVLSPTFVLIKKFEIRNPKSETNSKFKKFKFKTLYHIDAYRIEKPQEIFDLEWEEIIQNQQNIVVIEWADKIKKIMPKNALWIKFEHLGKDKRRITVIQKPKQSVSININ